MKLIRTGVIAAVCVFFAAAPLLSQNLLDNEEYRRAQELRQQAEEAFEDGDYDLAMELAEEAEEAIDRARELAQRMRDGFRAANARTLANRRLDEVRFLNVEQHYADEYEEALNLFDEGQDLYDDEEYVDARDRFLAVRDVLTDDLLASLRDIAREAQQVTEEDEPAGLPEYYVVRRIPERRDSFWRIAEYEFVYDNPWEWPRLYETNRDMLQDPDNPHLIQPGMEFRIPSLDNERREGVWRDGEIELD